AGTSAFRSAASVRSMLCGVMRPHTLPSCRSRITSPSTPSVLTRSNNDQRPDHPSLCQIRFWPPQPRSGEGPEVALKRPAVAAAEGLLIEALLKHARVVSNPRDCRVTRRSLTSGRSQIPYVNLSIHTAPDVRPFLWQSCQWAKSVGLTSRAPLVLRRNRLNLRRAQRMT